MPPHSIKSSVKSFLEKTPCSYQTLNAPLIRVIPPTERIKWTLNTVEAITSQVIELFRSLNLFFIVSLNVKTCRVKSFAPLLCDSEMACKTKDEICSFRIKQHSK